MAPDDATIIPSDVVEATLEAFTKIDNASDKRTMNKVARRLGKEQAALLQLAAALQTEHGPQIGEAAVFYATLIWAIFDRKFGKSLDTLTQENLQAAQEVVDAAREAIENLDERPIPERYPPELAERQPNIYAKICELMSEDLEEGAITEECATLVFPTTQVCIEAFDAAATGKRPGERHGPIVRETPKVGRNEPCPCGSGKKYKRCHGAAG